MKKSFAEQLKYNVELVTASNSDGEFYAYVLIPENIIDDFRTKISSDEINLEDYGVVLASGKGHIPSEEHIAYINNRFSKNTA